MNPVVFDWFRSNMQAMAGGDVPFFDTLGKALDQAGLPDVWLSMETDDSGMQRLTVGRPAIFRELGTVTAVFVSKSGRGADAGLAAGQRFADLVRDTNTYYQTSLVEPSGIVGTLRIENVSTPDPADYEDGNWLLCSVVCAYTYDSVRGAAS